MMSTVVAFAYTQATNQGIPNFSKSVAITNTVDGLWNVPAPFTESAINNFPNPFNNRPPLIEYISIPIILSPDNPSLVNEQPLLANVDIFIYNYVGTLPNSDSITTTQGNALIQNTAADYKRGLVMKYLCESGFSVVFNDPTIPCGVEIIVIAPITSAYSLYPDKSLGIDEVVLHKELVPMTIVQTYYPQAGSSANILIA
jgi:hypothetical protein